MDIGVPWEECPKLLRAREEPKLWRSPFCEAPIRLAQEKQGIDTGQGRFQQRQAFVRAEDEQGGGQSVSRETVLGQYRDAGDGVAHGCRRARINNMGAEDARLVTVEVAIVAGGGNGAAASQRHYAMENARVVWAKHADAPGLAVGVKSVGEGFTTDLDQKILQSALPQEHSNPIDAKSLGDSTQVEQETRDVLTQEIVICDGQMPPADSFPDGGKSGGRRGVASEAIGAEPPEIDQRADGGVEGSARDFSVRERGTDDLGEVRSDRKRFVGARAVEARDFAVRLPDGHLAVDFFEHHIDIGMKLLQCAAIKWGISNADRIRRAHGMASKDGVAWCGSTADEEAEDHKTQYPMST